MDKNETLSQKVTDLTNVPICNASFYLSNDIWRGASYNLVIVSEKNEQEETMAYQIFTDATADPNESMVQGLPDVQIIPMEFAVGDKRFTYGSGDSISIHAFYSSLRDGEFAATSQINPNSYREAFEPWLQNGIDVIYLCFSSGLSGTIQAANMAMEELREEYPDCKIICLDTLGASVGEGLLVCGALKKQAEGLTFEDLCAWVLANRNKVCHWFTVDTFTHLKHGGRVSSTTAALGTVLNIKPLLHVDEEGTLKPVENHRGRVRAMQAQLEHLKAGWCPEIDKTIVVAHGDAPENAQLLKSMVSAAFPDANVHTADIGPIIGAHSGPGTMLLVYWGNNR